MTRRRRGAVNARKRSEAEQYLAQQSAAHADVKRAATQCGQRQEGDEYVCPGCSLRWDTREDRPPCPKEVT